MSRKNFKVGQDIWFRFENNRPAPVSEKFLYPTKEEAENDR